MNKYNTWVYSAVLALFFILTSYAQQESLGALSQQRNVLSARLDSLEMEKQIRKHKGESIADLEYECRKMYDSLALLRTRLSSGEEAYKPSEDKVIKPEKNKVLLFIQSLFKPSNIFDWIIIIVGIIALLSGIILITGIIVTVVKRSKRRARPSTYPAPRKTSFERAQKAPLDVSSSEPGKTSDSEDRGIDTLRERVRKDIKDIQRFNSGKTPFSTADTPSDQQNERENKEVMRDSVIRASKEGLDVQEISRRYHISVDQVSLILRVADKDNSKKK